MLAAHMAGSEPSAAPVQNGGSTVCGSGWAGASGVWTVRDMGLLGRPGDRGRTQLLGLAIKFSTNDWMWRRMSSVAASLRHTANLL